MKLPDIEFSSSTDPGLLEFVDYLRIILNDGRYQLRTVGTSPTWTGIEGEMVLYAAGTERGIYYFLNNQWNASMFANSTGQNLITLGSADSIISGDAVNGFWVGNATFLSAPFRVTLAGALTATSATISGAITATSGTIGGFTIGADALTAGTGATAVGMAPGTYPFYAGNTTATSAPFYVSNAGLVVCNNIRVRGKISASVFEKDVISSVGGNLLISSSDILSTDMTALDSSTMTIVGDTTFAVNDRLRINDGVNDEWFVVTNIASAPIYTVTRDQDAQYSANNNPVWTKGTAVINYGASGSGLIYMTASDTNAPYIDILTHAGSPWDTITTLLRIGKVTGFLSAAAGLYGIYVGTSDAYLKYDQTNGLQIKGSITVTGGGWSHSSDPTKIDGGDIYTGTVTADKITAGTYAGGNFVVGSGGAVQSSDYSAGVAGFKLAPTTGLEVNTGVILGTVIDRTQSIFTSSGTFVAPSGTSQVFITMCGGGGGGGGGEDDASGGGGGGGGGAETIVKYPFTVTGGSSYTVTIGLGGPGGAQKTDGSTGSSTSFSSVTVLGGYPGVKGGGAANGAGGGARGTLDASNLTPGGLGLTSGTGSQASSLGASGAGGGTLFGIGGAGKASQGGVGNNATGYGAGGGGGTQGPAGQPGWAGGNGSPGICIVEW